MPCLYKLLQVILQCTTLLDSMTLLSVVSTVQTLIPSGQAPAHLPRPSEVRLILNMLKDLVDELFEGRINTLGPQFSSLYSRPLIPFWFSAGISQVESLYCTGRRLGFACALQACSLSSSNLLCSSILLIS